MTTALLDRELQTFEAHKAELLKSNPGEFVLIHEDQIVDTFVAEWDAIKQGFAKFGNTPFLVKPIEEIEEILHFAYPIHIEE